MAEIPLNVSERNDLVPVCPFCEKELDQIFIKSKGFPIWVGKSMVCFCPHCRKVLGFAQSRMG